MRVELIERGKKIVLSSHDLRVSEREELLKYREQKCHAMSMQRDRLLGRYGVLEETCKPLFLTPKRNADIPEA